MLEGSKASVPVEGAASKFLDEKQLCTELGISPVTTTRWRRTGEGPPFVRIGRLIRYPRSAIDTWIAVRTVGLVKQAG